MEIEQLINNIQKYMEIEQVINNIQTHLKKQITLVDDEFFALIQGFYQITFKQKFDNIEQFRLLVEEEVILLDKQNISRIFLPVFCTKGNILRIKDKRFVAHEYWYIYHNIAIILDFEEFTESSFKKYVKVLPAYDRNTVEEYKNL
jgi:hypothetical protein